jgi:aryl-alcohol dehydrogenase-like predicted oxidoreductase
MMATVRRLGLGTVQFGLSYGVSNVVGRFPEQQVAEVLDYAWREGIRTLDTANAYGDSEVVLGRNLSPTHDFEIVTKTVPVAATTIDATVIQEVERGLRTSLERLGVQNVHGVLVHQADNLIVPGGERLYELLAAWKQAGRIRHIGVSVYDSRQLLQVTERFRVDIVQLPLNVFDQRMLRDGSVGRLHAAGVKVHVRSVFLQGLLLMRPEELPPHLARFAGRLTQYRQHLAQLQCSALEAALGFIKGIPEVDVALIGINSPAHLRECIDAYDRSGRLDLAAFGSEDVQLIDPRHWKAA